MLKLKTQLDIVCTRFGHKHFSARGRPGGVRPSSVNLGPPNISESKRAKKLKLKTPLDILTYSPGGTKKIPLGGVQGAQGPPNVNLGPPKISETTRARMLKIKNTITYCEVLALGKKYFLATGVQTA